MVVCFLFLQNQLLTKGMVILRDKLRFYEGGCDLIVAGEQMWSKQRVYLRFVWS